MAVGEREIEVGELEIEVGDCPIELMSGLTPAGPVSTSYLLDETNEKSIYEFSVWLE